MAEREKFSSRMGFILLSAGCAIGLGNVWRFPYIVGQYGGAAFVLLYLLFLLILGLPIVIMEFSVGRASQKSAAMSFDVLEPKGSKWHLWKYGAIAGNYLLMMFYTTVAGWMILYFCKMVSGEFVGKTPPQISTVFHQMKADPVVMIVSMIVIVVFCFGICAAGLRRGVEKVTKVMMLFLLALMLILAVRSVSLQGGQEGLEFYLYPDFSKLFGENFQEAVFAAMGQAFFTLSIGVGSLAIFGSYLKKDRSLTGEAVSVTILDTFVALVSGLIIFPACSAFSVQPDSGPDLIFLTLPNIFAEMQGGQIWGSLFFLFLSFAAISTVIAVFENILSFWMDLKEWSRKKSVAVNLVLVIVLSLPCVLGFNLWNGFQPFGIGTTVMDLEDFIISNNLLPIGSMVYVLFCTSRYGWGWNHFIEEANSGKGMRFPQWARVYVTFVLPIVVLGILIQGYFAKFWG